MKFITAHKDIFALLAIVIVAGVLYAGTLKGLPGNPVPADFKGNLDDNAKPFELSPERGRFAQVMALGENGTYVLSRELADIAYPDVGYIEGRFYSYFAPGLPFLVTPAYLLGYEYGYSQVFTFAFISLVSILTLLFLYKIGRNILKLHVWASFLAVFTFAFGSTAWSYAVTLYQHHLTAFFLIASFYAVWKFRQGGRFGWLWAVFAAANVAVGMTVDYPNLLLLSPILAYLVLASVHGEIDKAEKVQESQQVDPTLTPEQISEQTRDKTAIGFFSERNLARGIGVLLFGSERGLFVYAPAFFLAIFGLAMALKRVRGPEVGILFASVLVIVFLYSSWGDPWGGWAYGPRYLIPAMAPLSLFVGYFVANSARRFLAWALTIILLLYSSAVALL